MRNKDRETAIRREVALWQALTVGFAVCLALLAVCAVAVGSRWSGIRQELKDSAADWETRYNAAKAIERDAVAAYGEKVAAYDRLVAAVELEKEQREAQARAYEALGKYQYLGEFMITHYCCEQYTHICGTGDGITASGIPVSPGIVAVDPDVIPLGSTVIIDGVSYLAADTGALVKDNHIDIAVETHAEAIELGISNAEVWIIPPGGDRDAG